MKRVLTRCHHFSCYTVTDMYNPSPFRAGNIQKLMYGGANDVDSTDSIDEDKAEPETESLLSSEEDDSGDLQYIILKDETVTTSKLTISPCTRHNLMMVSVVVLLLIGLTVAAIIRDRNIARHKKIASLRRDNVFNRDLPEFSIVRSPKMNKYMVLLIIPIVSILVIASYYGMRMTGKLGDCSYSWLHTYGLGPFLLLISALVIYNKVKTYKQSQKDLGSIKKRVDAMEKFTKDNLYNYNYNTSANRLRRRGVSTASPEQMYRALSKGRTVDDAIHDAVKAALDNRFYLTTRMDDHKLNLQHIIYTLSLYQFMMDDKVGKKQVKALFSLTGIYAHVRIAEHMRTYTRVNMGDMRYIDNVATYVNRYSTIRMDSASMRTLKRKVAEQLHKTSEMAAAIRADKGWRILKRLDNDYLELYIISILMVPLTLMVIGLGFVVYKQYKKWLLLKGKPMNTPSS